MHQSQAFAVICDLISFVIAASFLTLCQAGMRMLFTNERWGVSWSWGPWSSQQRNINNRNKVLYTTNALWLVVKSAGDKSLTPNWDRSHFENMTFSCQWWDMVLWVVIAVYWAVNLGSTVAWCSGVLSTHSRTVLDLNLCPGVFCVETVHSPFVCEG